MYFRFSVPSQSRLLKSLWKDGAQSVTAVTKRPMTAGTNFKNSIIALVENLATKVNPSKHKLFV